MHDKNFKKAKYKIKYNEQNWMEPEGLNEERVR